MSVLPPVTLLYGDDEFAIANHVMVLKGHLGAKENAVLNVTVFEAVGFSFVDFRSVCESVPFLCEQRLVIVKDVFSRGKSNDLSGDAGNDLLSSLIRYLPELPASTSLLLLEHKNLAKNSRLIKAVRSLEAAVVRQCKIPDNRDLGSWILKRAEHIGGDFSTAAAQELAAAGIASTRALQMEIDKLLSYVNWERSVTAEDVRRIVPGAVQGDIFRLVDSLGERNAHRAMAQLHNLIDSGERDVMNIFGMVVRQYRLLLQAKEILEQGGTPTEVKVRLGLPRFVAEKISIQSRRYRLGNLESIYRRLLAMDIAMKSGGDHHVLLDMMVVGLTV